MTKHVPVRLGFDQPPDETTLLAATNSSSMVNYRRGVIRKQDRTLDPMVPPGSIVYVDPKKRIIPTRRNWTHAFQRPIYFLLKQDAYVCGWCELDDHSEWLTLIPHPLSPVPERRWKYRTEIENMGRVVAVTVPLAD